MVTPHGSFRHRFLGTGMYRNRLAIASHLYTCPRGWRNRHALALGGKSLSSLREGDGASIIWLIGWSRDLVIMYFLKFDGNYIYFFKTIESRCV